MILSTELSHLGSQMDIRNVAENSSVERASDRPVRTAKAREVLIPTNPRDGVRIGARSRAAAAAFAKLVQRSRAGDRARQDLVAEAIRKLKNGDLDSEVTVSETARRVQDARFLDS